MEDCEGFDSPMVVNRLLFRIECGKGRTATVSEAIRCNKSFGGATRCSEVGIILVLVTSDREFESHHLDSK